MSDQLEKNILATVIYFDCLEYAPTAFEVWHYLMRSDYYSEHLSIHPSLAQIMYHLGSDHLRRFVTHHDGCWVLRGREELVSARRARQKISAQKIRKLHRWVRMLRFVPFVRMIGVTGRLSKKDAGGQSDWDLFVVLKGGAIWRGRTLITALLHVLGKRRHGSKVRDRICLNYFITEDSLEVPTKDLFSANEYMFMRILYGWETFERFQFKNRWIEHMKPNYHLREIPPLDLIVDSAFSRAMRSVGEWVLAARWLEQVLGRWQQRKIMRNPKTHLEGSLIYARDDALVFLPQPHGPRVFEKFKEKVESLSART